MLLLERCHRMMTPELGPLETRRGKATTTSVTVAQAGQVNVDCAVVNEAGVVIAVPRLEIGRAGGPCERRKAK